VTRKMNRFNFIPSNYGGTYRDDLKTMIEDPLPKNSAESHFIQIADVVSFVVYLYASNYLTREPIAWANRVKKVLKEGDETDALNILKSVLNLKASKGNEFGIVHYPK